ncbi:MAG: hypothetical protein M3285_03385 [Actinomycetota bacterium]|nr:hypothetical protein [Actinomycetota bacterium]
MVRTPSWGGPVTRRHPVEGAWAALVLGVPGLILVVGGWLLVGPVAALVVGAIYVASVMWWIGGLGRRALSSEGAQPLNAGTAPRLFNLVRGLAKDLDIAAPALWVLPNSGPNAFVCRAGRGHALALAPAVYEDFTRTELEALVAHCLARLASSGEVTRASLSAGLGGLAGPLIPSRDLSEDIRAAALTRYPPALATAIERCEPRGGRFAPLWFVPRGTRYPSPTARAEALRDL